MYADQERFVSMWIPSNLNNNNNNNTSICKAHNVSIRAESEAPAVAIGGEDG